MYAATLNDMCKVSCQLQDSHLQHALDTRLVRAAGWQGGRQDGLTVVFNCLPATGWKFSSRPPENLQGVELFIIHLFF